MNSFQNSTSQDTMTTNLQELHGFSLIGIYFPLEVG